MGGRCGAAEKGRRTEDDEDGGRGGGDGDGLLPVPLLPGALPNPGGIMGGGGFGGCSCDGG
jgi:hypothetical protein